MGSPNRDTGPKNNSCAKKIAILIKGHGPGGLLRLAVNFVVAKNLFIFATAGDCSIMVYLLPYDPNCCSK